MASVAAGENTAQPPVELIATEKPGSAPTSTVEPIETKRRLSTVLTGAHSAAWVEGRQRLNKAAYRPGLRRPLLGRWLTKHVWSINGIELVWFAIAAGITAGTSAAGLGVAINALLSLLLIPRNSIFTYVAGVAYERAVRYHTWVGVFMLVPMMIHGIGQGLFGAWDEGTKVTGGVGVIIYVMLLVCALPPVRRNKWEIFKWLHYAFVLFFLVIATIHNTLTIAVVAAGLVLYGVDMAIRVQRQLTPAEVVSLRTVEGSSVIGLEVNAHNAFRFTPGQYGYLMIPHVSRTEWHPFSACGDPKKSTIMFYIKPMGGWTTKALSVIQAGDRVRIDGPYGLPAVSYMEFPHVILFAGGIGITPLMSICRGALQACHNGENFGVVREIDLYWAVRTPSDFLCFADQIADMRRNEHPDLVNFRIHLFSSADQADLGIEYTRGRMDTEAALKEYAKLPAEVCCSGLRAHKDAIAVMACGPSAMTASLALMCADLSSEKLAFHYHAESFLL